jgi:hypothetical protein
MDLSASFNNGTLFNFVTCGTYGWQGDGSVGSPYALNLDGVNNYVIVPSSSSLNFDASTSFTAAAWIKADSSQPSGFAGIVTKSHPNNTWPVGGWQFAIYSNKLYVELISVGNAVGMGLQGSATITTGNWTYVTLVVRRADQSVKIYINAALDASTTHAAAAVSYSSSNPLVIGAERSLGGRYKGSITTVQLYNRALAASEIIKNCNAQVARFSGAACAQP